MTCCAENIREFEAIVNGVVKTFYTISDFRDTAAISTIVQNQLFKTRHIP
jgi:hypothetical protein